MSIALLLDRKQASPTTTAGAKTPGTPGLPALHLVQQTRWMWRIARVLLVVILLTPIALLLLPWQQTLSATGKVVALGPEERQQIIDAPLDGRVKAWHVCEGQQVRKGDLVVSLEDPDPQFTQQLAREWQANDLRRQAAEERAASFQAQVKSLEGSRKDALEAASSRLEMGRRREQAAAASVEAARKTYEVADFAYRMDGNLFAKELISGLEYQTSEQRRTLAKAEVERAKQAHDAAKAEIEALSADLRKTQNDLDASIRSATASKQSAEADRAAAVAALAQLEVRQARQNAQEVRAPTNGTIYRILANSSAGSTLVKYGDPLCIIVPEIKDDRERMVELLVHGNDMPLITELWRDRRASGGEESVRVRMQFQGWPALQFSGWPSVMYGTFGGVVHFVDPHADEDGNFRILVKPDPEEEAVNPWPTGWSLRQGVRAKGWILLNRVTVGWEIWRQLNGFPPVVATKEPEDNLKKK